MGEGICLHPNTLYMSANDSNYEEEKMQKEDNDCEKESDQEEVEKLKSLKRKT